MATASAMYRSGKDPLHRVSHSSADVHIPKGARVRRLHKAFLRYHDPENWPMLRAALKRMGRNDLIGNGKMHLVPPRQPAKRHQVVPATSRPFATQHNGLPRAPRCCRPTPRTFRPSVRTVH